MLLAWMKAFVKAWVLPPAGPLLVALAGLVLSARHPRTGRWLALAGFVTLVALSMPITSDLLILSMGRVSPLDLRQAANAQGIVILGAGLREDAPEYGGASPGILTLQRIRYGARVARETGLPVLVSGGPTKHGPPEALVMRDALVGEFGISVRWIESQSLNTHENATLSAGILKANGVAKVILITHSFDIFRASAEFSRAGISTVRAPTGIPSSSSLKWGDFLPTAAGLHASYYAVYELLANGLLFLS